MREIASVQEATILVSHRARAWRRVFSFPAALAGVVGVTVFAIARTGLADPDVWWHLRNAEYLVSRHQLIRADMYSFTVYGHAWMNHEWLAEIPYYFAWRLFGLVGIKTLSLVLLETIFGGLLYLCWRRTGNIKASAVASYFAILLGSVSFGPRTLLFGYLYLLVLIGIMEEVHERREAPLWLLPPLFCLWINTHGSWSLGLIVFAIYICGGLIEGRWGSVEARRWTSAHLRRLGGTMLASVAALFLNPYGYRLVLYPFDLAFHQNLNVAHVAEWASVDFHDARGKIALAFVLTLLLGALFSRHRWQLYELGLAVFGIYTALTYVRFLFLAGILAAPLIARFFSFIPRYRPDIDRPVLNAVLMLGALAFVVAGYPTANQLEQSVDRQYPAEVLPKLDSLNPSDRVLNYYLWGGYLGWKDPAFRDFIDSRVDVFEYAGVLRDYLDLLELKNPDAILDKYTIRYVLFPPGEPLAYALQHNPRWKVAFHGNTSILFERMTDTSRSPSNKS